MTLRTHGDTEVLLETLRLKSLAGLADLNGQFAFGYHDEDSGELLLARDRMGILPLYYHEGPGLLASEVKALIDLIGTPGVDGDAVEDYLTYGSVPPPLTLLKGIRKLALRFGRKWASRCPLTSGSAAVCATMCATCCSGQTPS